MFTNLKTRVDDTLFASAGTIPARRAAEQWKEIQAASQRGAGSVVITITPELAEIILSANPDNRRIKTAKVMEIAQDIREGRFVLNGETIIISKDGYLNDGQNRLNAVIEAARSIKTYIAYGVARETRLTVDLGTARSPGDFLTMQGIANANDKAAITHLLWQFHKFGTIPRHQAGHAYRTTKPALTEFYIQHRDEVDSAIAATPQTNAAKLGSFSILAFAYLLIARVAPREDARAFMVALCSGENLAASSAIYKARERLLDEKRKGPIRKDDVLEIVLRGWNAYRAGNRAKKIQLSGQLPRIAG
jgi:hypothetical protein